MLVSSFPGCHFNLKSKDNLAQNPGDITDQRNLQSDCLTGMHDHVQPSMVSRTKMIQPLIKEMLLIK